MDKYEVKGCIGRGNYGSAHVVVCRKDPSVKFVMKKIPIELMSEMEKEQAHQEVDLLAKLHHPNIVAYKESFVENDALHIIMSYCEGGDLARHIKKMRSQKDSFFSEEQILDWFVQMAMAIQYMHERRVLHRDLKTSNIFLTSNNIIKLGDFGIARVLDSTLEQAKTVVGTPYYMSPEVCENKPYSYASDIWALGCVLYETCTLEHAFKASNLLGLVFKIVQQQHPPIPAHFSQELSQLVEALLSKDPAKRPTLKKIFAMPFIRERTQALVNSGGSLGQETCMKHSTKQKSVIVIETNLQNAMSPNKVEESRSPDKHALRTAEPSAAPKSAWIVNHSKTLSIPSLPPPPVLTNYHLNQNSIATERSTTDYHFADKTESVDQHSKVTTLHDFVGIELPERSSSPERLLPPASQLKRQNRQEKWAQPCNVITPFNGNMETLEEQIYHSFYQEECSDSRGVDFARDHQIDHEIVPPVSNIKELGIESPTTHEDVIVLDDFCDRRKVSSSSTDEVDRQAREMHELEIEMDLVNTYDEDFPDDDDDDDNDDDDDEDIDGGVDTSTSNIDGEENYYSDDFESENEDEVLEYSSNSFQDNQDLQEVRQNAAHVLDVPVDGLAEVDPATPRNNTTGGRRASFAEKIDLIRLRLQSLLGEHRFNEVYSFLRVMHRQGKTNCKSDLVRMVGRSKLPLCFEVDQLIYFEEMIETTK